MAIDKTTFASRFNNVSTGKFKDNTSNDIGADDVRDLVLQINDGFFNTTDNAYNGAKGLKPGVTSIATLKAVATVLIDTTVHVLFRDTASSNILRVYELVSGTDAESSPTIIRPDDYAGTTNEKVWKLAVVATSSGTVESVTGDGVDNTDPDNPVLSFPLSTEVQFTSAGTIAATNVQAAIEEVNTEAKAYADSLVVGLWDDRGNFDASGGAYPSSGGSGSAGAILKGDIWTISVAGTLPTGQVVAIGDTVRAKQDTPGNTQANWAIQETNIGYTPVNKVGDTMSGNLAMGSNKVTGLAEASGNGEAVRYEQITPAVQGLVTQVITNGVTTTSPSEDAVFDALALKANLTDVIGVQDLYIPASAMWPRTTGPCADLAKTELATSLVNIQSLDFDQTTQEFAQFTIVLPRKYNNGTVTAVVYWTAAAGSGDVQWGISGGAYSNDDALTVALGTAITVDDTLIATNDLHITTATSAITLAGTPADADFLAFQISRNPGSDTLSGDAKLLGVSIRITTDAGKDA